MDFNQERYKAKGWSDEEIEHAKGIFARSNKHNHPKLKKYHTIMYWVLLLLILCGAIIGAWLIEPFLFFLNPTQAVVTIGIIGLLYGILASILVKDLEQLQSHHHVIIALIMPISAISTSMVITNTVQKIGIESATISQHNPVFLGIAFSICAIIPYGLFLLMRWKKNGSV